MATLTCDHCGLPFRGTEENEAPHFCCSGCKLVYEITAKNSSANSFSESLPVPESLVVRWILSIILVMPLMLTAVTDYIEGSLPLWLHYLNFIAATAILLLLGKEHVIQLAGNRKSGHIGLAELILLGIVSSYGISVYHFITQNGPTFFETTGMLLVFYTASLLLDIYLKNRIHTESSLETLRDEMVEVKIDGEWRFQSADAVTKGDIIRVQQDQLIVFDGILTSSNALFHQHYLTGEEHLRTIRQGEHISSGLLPADVSIELRVERALKDSGLTRYLQEVDTTRESRSSLEHLSEKLGRMLLLTISLLAVGTFAITFYLIGLEEAIFRSLAVLLIGCPCTFSIATPAAFWIAQRQLFQKGIVLRKGSQILEKVSGSGTVVWDKTGTLTDSLSVSEIVYHPSAYTKEIIIGLIRSAELHSNHPVARAIKEWMNVNSGIYETFTMHPPEILAGAGIRSVTVDDKYELIIKASEATEESLEIIVNESHVATLMMTSSYRTSLPELFRKLKRDQISSIVLTGDPQPRSDLVNNTDLESYKYGLSPNEKLHMVEQLKSRSSDTILFVGDGINDLGAMAASDIAVAVSNSNTATLQEADVLIHSSDLNAIQYLIGLSRKTIRTIHGNFLWTIIYNIAGIILAMAGFLHPIFAVLIMMISSFSVTIHSLRLKAYRSESN